MSIPYIGNCLQKKTFMNFADFGMITNVFLLLFLNQARAVLRPVHTQLLKLILCGSSVCVCVCPRPRLLITSGVMWRDMDLIGLVKQVLQLLYGNCSRYR